MFAFYPNSRGQGYRELNTGAGTFIDQPESSRRVTARTEDEDARVAAQFLRRHRGGDGASRVVRQMQLGIHPNTPLLSFEDTHRFYILLDLIDQSDSLEQLQAAVPSFLKECTKKMDQPLYASFKEVGLTDILRTHLSAEENQREGGVPSLKTLASLYLCIRFMGEVRRITSEAISREGNGHPEEPKDSLQGYEEKVANANRAELDTLVHGLEDSIKRRNLHTTFKAHIESECLLNARNLSNDGFNTLVETMAFANYPLQLSEALRSDRINLLSTGTAEQTLMHLINHHDWSNFQLMQRFIPLISDHYFIVAINSACRLSRLGNTQLIDLLRPFANRIPTIKNEIAKENQALVEFHFSDELGGASLPCAIL